MHDWFDNPAETPTGERGLRFQCTMCGNCCTGPPGYVLVTDTEVDRLAARTGLSRAEFTKRYTELTRKGLSLAERRTRHGFDCVFLDRDSIPGKAICSVYEDRPSQCRSWPFWEDNLRSPDAWRNARRTCPGIDHGPLHTPQQIRVRRDGDSG